MDGPKLEDMKQNVLRHQIERDRRSARELIKEKKYLEACSHLMSLSAIFRKTAYLYPPDEASHLLELASNYETLVMAIRNKEMAPTLQNIAAEPADMAGLLFFPEKPEERWRKVGGLEDAKIRLRELARAHRAIMVYGAGGSGKRLLARTLASSRDIVFFEISVSNVLTRYFGDSRRVIDALFDRALRSKGAVIFLEGLDRFTKERTAIPETKSVMLYLLAKAEEAERFAEQEIFVLASAAEPWKMDPDAVERFTARLYVTMPDEESRAAIFRSHLDGCDTAAVDMAELAKRTEGLGGREISDMCYGAMERMLLEQNPGLGEINVRTLQGELAVRPLKTEDFVVETRPQPFSEQEYVLWKNEFGG
jgi:katanin p60 ATPase-containing subunit A1